MTTPNGWLTLNEKSLTATLRQAARDLEGGEGQLHLDFTSVRRIDSSALQAIEEFVERASEKGVKVVLRGINPYLYRVLKLVKLTSRFSFANLGAGAELESDDAQSSTK